MICTELVQFSTAFVQASNFQIVLKRLCVFFSHVTLRGRFSTSLDKRYSEWLWKDSGKLELIKVQFQATQFLDSLGYLMPS